MEFFKNYFATNEGESVCAKMVIGMFVQEALNSDCSSSRFAFTNDSSVHCNDNSLSVDYHSDIDRDQTPRHSWVEFS